MAVVTDRSLALLGASESSKSASPAGDVRSTGRVPHPALDQLRDEVLVVAAPAMSVRRAVGEGERRHRVAKGAHAFLEATHRSVEKEGVGQADIDLDKLSPEL